MLVLPPVEQQKVEKGEKQQQPQQQQEDEEEQEKESSPTVPDVVVVEESINDLPEKPASTTADERHENEPVQIVPMVSRKVEKALVRTAEIVYSLRSNNVESNLFCVQQTEHRELS